MQLKTFIEQLQVTRKQYQSFQEFFDQVAQESLVAPTFDDQSFALIWTVKELAFLTQQEASDIIKQADQLHLEVVDQVDFRTNEVVQQALIYRHDLQAK